MKLQNEIYTTHRIHVWDIYLHLVDVYDKCISTINTFNIAVVYFFVHDSKKKSTTHLKASLFQS